MATPAANSNPDQDLNLDSLVARLLEVRGQRAGKTVQMTETEVRALCLRFVLSRIVGRSGEGDGDAVHLSRGYFKL